MNNSIPTIEELYRLQQRLIKFGARSSEWAAARKILATVKSAITHDSSCSVKKISVLVYGPGKRPTGTQRRLIRVALAALGAQYQRCGKGSGWRLVEEEDVITQDAGPLFTSCTNADSC